jgi:ATP adenylyltransferase
MDYIVKVDEPGCFICSAAAEEKSRDRENLVLYRGKEALIIMNRYPYNNGHLMIAPYAHTPDMLKLSHGCRDEILELCAKAMEIMEKNLGCHGFNCGMNFGKVAGAGLVDHFHLHAVPRWNGDVNFFPILADTKSMPEYLDKTYDRLTGGFEGM